jgi:hypothetical protein
VALDCESTRTGRAMIFHVQSRVTLYLSPMAYTGIFSGGQRERGSGGGSLQVRGSTQLANE